MKLSLFVGMLAICALCSCQRQELKDAGLGKEKTVRDKDGNYYRLKPHIGDTFFIEPLDIEDFQKF